MGAASVTGTGQGSSGKLTSTGLAILANGPSIHYTGFVELDDSTPTSPPLSSGTVIFPVPLPGGSENYVVLVTGISTGYTYIMELLEEDFDFTGFTAIGEFEGSVMYLVADVGIKPSVAGTT